MKLSTKIHDRADDTGLCKTAFIPVHRLHAWEIEAAELELSRRDAWRSFNVACGVVGLLVAALLWPRHHEAPAPAATPSEMTGDPTVLSRDPFELKAERSKAVWL